MQIDQRSAGVILHANQRDTNAAVNLSEMKNDFEFSLIKFKNSTRSEIGSEIENIFNFNSDAEKLNKKSYLIFRLYAAIFIQKKDIYGNFSGSIADLILQI
jgi:hypothetical protein